MKRAQPPPTIDGARVYTTGNPIVARNGTTWVKLRPYDQSDERRWLFSENGDLVESDPEP